MSHSARQHVTVVSLCSSKDTQSLVLLDLNFALPIPTRFYRFSPNSKSTFNSIENAKNTQSLVFLDLNFALPIPTWSLVFLDLNFALPIPTRYDFNCMLWHDNKCEMNEYMNVYNNVLSPIIVETIVMQNIILKLSFIYVSYCFTPAAATSPSLVSRDNNMKTSIKMDKIC
ncbi:hypothetical protein FF38_09218 [Lucilia cuprina]|uniref:Uncharacterized protein n=1 Tax=Lucilia cuprina TaxID=7375 RepID=A0A0L0CKY9_LUCCU|nr:hypothetical protein FF38_09218 [Lucilia cuprina]